MLDQCGRDLYHMARTLLNHRADGLLRDIEKPVQVRRKEIPILLIGTLRELVGNENSGVVDQRIDAAEARQRFFNDHLAGRRVADVASDCQIVRIVRRLN